MGQGGKGGSEDQTFHTFHFIQGIITVFITSHISCGLYIFFNSDRFSLSYLSVFWLLSQTFKSFYFSEWNQL